jgi:HK97 family phage major capsid protein
MSTLLKLKQKRSAKQAEAQKMLDAIANGAEHRDMSPEEKTKFDGLLSDVAALKDQIAQAKVLDEMDDDDEEMDAEPRSVRRSKPPGDAPAVHTDKHRYSYHRALRLASDKVPLDGIEGEIHREMEIRTGVKAKGFYMPTGQDPILRDHAMGWKPGTAQAYAERRDLTTTTGVGSIFTVPELPLIELLRSKLVIRMLGAQMLTDMKGNFAIPRQSGKSTIYWPGEGNSATISNPTLDQVAFVPKVAIAATNISRLFMNQTSLDAEEFTKRDLAESMAREFDRVALNGVSGSNQPVGILQNSTIQTNSASLALGSSGGVPTWATIVNMEAQLAALNADSGDKMAYLTTPVLRGVLKQTPKIGTTYPDFIWRNTPAPGVGEMNGYPAYATTNVPGNLTKGSGSGLSALIFADWSQLVCATWEGVDVVVNPYTNQLQGAVIVSTALSMDVEVRHPASFAIVTDAI